MKRISLAFKFSTYENHYVAIEKQPNGTWLLLNKVTGLYDERAFPDYDAARNSMVEITQRYMIIAKGGNPSYV